ncbi:Endoplasmic reticulum-based factor for assembly of V-ATPase family protein [Acanthocheilonema viteae]
MWEVSKEGAELLQDWLNELGDESMKAQNNRLVKEEMMIFEYDEMMSILNRLSKKFPIYKFIERIKPHVPVIEKKVNPEYEARLERLRQEQEDREYRKMTRSVDPNQIYGRENLLHGFGEEMKAVNRQLMVILNALLTVAGGFSFGYFGVAYAYPDLHMNVAFRIALGLAIGTVVFFADLYFIIKGMNDLGEKPIKAKKVIMTEKIRRSDTMKKMQ